MQTANFHCPHCDNLMAVGLELLGHQVQCPTCHQVVVAPSTTPPAEPEVSFDEPAKGDEEHESIFGEEHDEDVFGSRRTEIVVPDAAAPTAIPAPPPPSSNFADYPPQATYSVPESSPTPKVVIAPDHWPTAAEPLTQTETEPVWDHPVSPIHDDEAAPLDVRRPGPTREQRKGANLLLAILGPYSVLMTLLAGYYFYKAKWGSGNEHPLANIPDATALFDAPTRKQLTRRNEFMPPVDAALPDSLKVKLGGTLRIGDLEVTPERIEKGTIRVHTVGRDDQTNISQLPGEALILHLRVKNRSGDLSFCPTDPIFDRYYDKHRSASKPYNQIVIGKDHFYGGAIDVLGVNWKQVKRKFIAGQDNDDKPLLPGEQRQTVICTDPQDNVLPALKIYKGDDPLVWRVQLRRGLTEFNGKEYPVCALIGVQFSSADVE